MIMYSNRIMPEYYMEPTKHEFICQEHKVHEKEVPLSPARYNCKKCKKKKIYGYSNPDHICNPFGYLYLAPQICLDCATKTKKCMWC